MGRSNLAWGLWVVVAGCGIPAAPSPPEARRPTPKTVTRENPAGDAQEAEDAALTRLLKEPAGKRGDRFQTLTGQLPDVGHWRRVRIFGHPTRMTYRYGDNHFAIASIDYRAADGDGSPHECLQGYVDRAREVAARYSVELGPIERGEGQHWRGVESVDWDERVEDEARRKLERRTRATGSAPTTPPAMVPPPRASPEGTGQSRIAAALWGTTARPTARAATATSATPPSPLTLLPVPERRDRALQPKYGFAPMPYARVSGAFTTLFHRERYFGAVAAYRSWPRTCLVHAFAVRVGTDEALARKVIDRFIDELAPRLGWSSQLRSMPPVEDR